ncbi:MAG TPA: hypothetical protein VFQ80_10725, partial [Thermomicrobiales bacterium]|nr:hypothetical protein [Thermomicrobiales bacterium]
MARRDLLTLPRFRRGRRLRCGFGRRRRKCRRQRSAGTAAATHAIAALAGPDQRIAIGVGRVTQGRAPAASFVPRRVEIAAILSRRRLTDAGTIFDIGAVIGQLGRTTLVRRRLVGDAAPSHGPLITPSPRPRRFLLPTGRHALPRHPFLVTPGPARGIAPGRITPPGKAIVRVDADRRGEERMANLAPRRICSHRLFP